MSIVEQLADLTGHRDRDVLDVTLVSALKDLLRPRSVAIYRCVGESGAQRWLSRAKTRRAAVDEEAHASFSRFGVYRILNNQH